ncbi:MAG: glucose-6-phosphate isomerase [delta proteobacterium ML8_F1]|nr:MAG: glucose-6-phosphate isomerase [delta proteobacterium ML8_F1]
MKLNVEHSGISQEAVMAHSGAVAEIFKTMVDRTAVGAEFLGWMDYHEKQNPEVFRQIMALGEEIKEKAQALVVIGIGGSYLGARAMIEALGNRFDPGENPGVLVYFAGNNLSGVYLEELLKVIREKDIYVNVISKSGTTTEPAIAFRLIRRLMEEKYGGEARHRIIATTDASRGALRALAEEEGYRTFTIPDDIGGRYSVFTPVGLVPMAAAGIDIEAILAGIEAGNQAYRHGGLEDNSAHQYAVMRKILLEKGKNIEILVNYEPGMVFIAEWFKQLFGESEGKELKGIYPSSALFSTDLHSLGQYIQEGQRNLFETVLTFEALPRDVSIPWDEEDRDGLNYLTGYSLNEVNKKAFEGTLLAHVEGGVPNIVLRIESMDAFNLAKLLTFFMFSCAMSGYLIGVNPFNQPGVESYKNNMFALLGKTGYEDLKKTLEAKIHG